MGGDWDLEVQVGDIEAPLAFRVEAMVGYGGVLNITRISVATDGTQGDGYSYPFSISADGRYVAFTSGASNLVSGDTNNTWDIFVRDLQTNTTRRISLATDGTQGNNGSYFPSISADGRYVAFISDASNLVSGDTNNTWDVFVATNSTTSNNPISYAITASTTTITEGNSGTTPLTFTVTRSGGIDAASTVDYAIGGSATFGNDYNNIGGTSGATGTTGTINFAAGETSRTITLDVLGDTVIEPDETVSITLSNPVAPGLTPTITTAVATTTINNDDIAFVNFGAPTYSGTEETTETVVNIPISLSATPLTDITVPIVINGSSSATQGSDYTLSTTSVTFLAGATGAQLTQNVAVTINPDNIAENAETIVLDFGTITGANAGTTNQTTLTIAPNDPISYTQYYEFLTLMVIN